jgi:predicted Zn-dependent protease
MTRHELARLAESALADAPGELLATAWHERSLHVALERDAIATAHALQRTGLDVLAVVDGHTARATASTTTPDGVRDAAARARAAAEAIATAAGAPGDFPSVPEPAAPRGHEGFDAATARLGDELWRAPVDAALAVVRDAGAELDGAWEAGVVTTAVAATSGLRLTDATTDARLRIAVRDGGIAERAAVAAGALDGAAVAREALTEGLPSTDAAALHGGSYSVVLGPDAVAAVLALLGHCAFNGLLHAEGRGALVRRLGTRVAAATINLSDTPRFTGTLPHAFDADGVPKAPIPLIQDGVAHRVVHDLRSAARAGGGARSTGHALLPGGAPTGPGPRNMVLVGGGAADEHELAAPIERGAFLPRLDAVALLDPRTTAFTAVAGAGARLIEGGRIAQPLGPLHVTAEALGILAATEALSREPRLVGRLERFPGRPRFATGSIQPALRAHDVRVSAAATRTA